MKALDKLDSRILYELDKNCRLSASEIARIVRQGRDRVEYRIDKLIQSKIISRFTASVNLSTLGFTIYKMYVRLNASKEQNRPFLKFLRNHPRVYWIAISDGSWDLMLAVFARSPLEYYQIQQDILSEYNSLIISYEVYQLVQLDVYNKHYLQKSGDSYVTIGGKQGAVNLEILDCRLLKALSSNARRSNVELADTLGTTPAIVKGRIERLVKSQVITGFRVELDLRKLGMEFFKTQLFLRSYDKTELRKLRTYCKKNPHITYYIQQLGSSSIEIELEVVNYQHYYEIIEDLRAHFSQLIRNFQTIIIRKTYFNWVPEDLDEVLSVE